MEQQSHPLIYDSIGSGYRQYRNPDPRIAVQIREAIGDATTVCNVGAGAGSYEPRDLDVTAVEPSERMIEQRDDAESVIRATAEELPLHDGQFDASMAVLTVHHWSDPVRGLLEMQRISRRQVILTFDPTMIDSLWLVRDYLPEIVEFERSRATLIETFRETLGACNITAVMIPWDCSDGFQAAYWRRPKKYLDPVIRKSISTFSQLPANVVSSAMSRLAEDIGSGYWIRRYSHLMQRNEMDFGYRLVVANNEAEQ